MQKLGVHQKSCGIAKTLSGFTLIELSIVLVIIALITGGVLVGKELIAISIVRSQISQIEQYRTAVNAFRGKYNCLPGDCRNAASYGFSARGTYRGQGDGNELIEGNRAAASWAAQGNSQNGGETQAFWRDLSQVGLIDNALSVGSANSAVATAIDASSTPPIDAYFPLARIGRSNYVFVFSYNGINYLLLQAATVQAGGDLTNIASLSPLEAKTIDGKLDDGLPQSGKVLARWSVGSWNMYDTGPQYNTAIYDNYGACYDNAGVAGVVRIYSTGQKWNTYTSAYTDNNNYPTACLLAFVF